MFRCQGRLLSSKFAIAVRDVAALWGGTRTLPADEVRPYKNFLPTLKFWEVLMLGACDPAAIPPKDHREDDASAPWMRYQGVL